MINGTAMNNLPPARWLPKNALTTKNHLFKNQPERSITNRAVWLRLVEPPEVMWGWNWMDGAYWSEFSQHFFMVVKFSWSGDWMLHVWSSFGIFSSTRLKSPGLAPLVGRFCSRKSQAWESKSCWINCWVESPSLCPSEEDGIHTPVGVEFLQC